MNRFRSSLVSLALSPLFVVGSALAGEPAAADPQPTEPPPAESPPESPPAESPPAADEKADATPPPAPADGKLVQASELPPSAAKRQILEVQKLARDGKLGPSLTQHALSEAVRAAERARGARDAGDSAHGTLLDKLAAQWASAGKSVVRAVLAERAAKRETSRLSELVTKVKRAEALLHEQQARLGRLRSELKRLEDKAQADQATAAEVEKKRVGAGTNRPAPPPKGKP